MSKPSLFEFLATPAQVLVHSVTTSKTFADSDEYDVPSSGDGLSTPQAVGEDYFISLDTRQDNETYDDDSGLDGLGIGSLAGLETMKTAAPGDPYDPPMDILSTATPTVLLGGTDLTETDTETYDDDGSIEGFSFPAR